MSNRIAILLVLGMVALALPATAQDENVVGLIIHVKPKAGMKDKWEEGAKKHMAFHGDKGDPWTRIVWEIVSGENVGDFVIGSFGHKWADFDNVPVSGSDEDAADLKINGAPYTESANVKYIEDMPKHSVAPAEGTPPAKLVTLVTVHAKPDKVEGYLNAVSKIPGALAKAGSDTKYYFSRAVTGGRQPSFIIFFPHESWAEMGPTPFRKLLDDAYGRVEAESILRALNEAAYDMRTTILAYREDLSYMPSSPSSD